MPTVPKASKCATLACTNPRARYGGNCIEHGGRDHQRKYTNDKRKEADSKYASAFWQSQRIAHLSANPLCASCLIAGIVTPATDVDHVFPWQQIGEAAFYANRFQSLCRPCHSAKTAFEQKGIYIYFDGAELKYSAGDYQRIVDTK